MGESVLEVHEARVRALVAGDLDALDRYVADDLTFTTPHGTVLTKPMVFDRVRSGRMKVDHMEVDDLSIREHGDAAIVTYRAVTRYSDDGVMVDGTVRSTTIYLRREGVWKLAAAQQSLITD